MISGFPREVDENSALLGCYAASSVNPLPTFQDNLSDRLYRNVGKEFFFFFLLGFGG